MDYVAVRLVLTRLLWPEAYVANKLDTPKPTYLSELPVREAAFRKSLLDELLTKTSADRSPQPSRPDAQLVFCIDVRSEPFRRALEAVGHYETLGFAEFFGLPVGERARRRPPHDSCPVLLKPRHLICDHAVDSHASCVPASRPGRSLLRIKNLFTNGLRYNFATPLRW